MSDDDLAHLATKLEDVHADTDDDERAGVILSAMAALRRCAREGWFDEKGRGPAYWRGFADGRIAERAGAES